MDTETKISVRCTACGQMAEYSKREIYDGFGIHDQTMEVVDVYEQIHCKKCFRTITLRYSPPLKSRFDVS